MSILCTLSALALAVGQPVAPSLPPLPADDEPTLEDRVEQLEDEIVRLRAEVAAVEQPVKISGYVDIGFFAPRGNAGVGWIQDFGNTAFPQYRGQYGWVFLGDILAPMVNSRGEPASLGRAPGTERFDSIDSKGAPGFIVSEVNLRADVSLAKNAIASASIDFVPRTGSEFALGDFFELDEAQLEWIVDEAQTTSVFVGKIEPVFGIEYKDRRADRRFGVTPSLVQRYTSGSQLGLKFRSRFFDDALIVAGAVTNGSSVIEPFHFHNEVDTNIGKTGSARIATKIPMRLLSEALGSDTLEIGASGELGVQDRALDDAGLTWFAGVDFEYISTSFMLKGQWIRGFSEGRGVDRVWALDLKDSGYVEANWMILPEFGVVARAGLRNAFVSLTTERAYVTKSIRLTGGVRFVITRAIVLKAEYLHNREFSGISEFDNDIFTSSLLLRY